MKPEKFQSATKDKAIVNAPWVRISAHGLYSKIWANVPIIHTLRGRLLLRQNEQWQSQGLIERNELVRGSRFLLLNHFILSYGVHGIKN